MKQNTEIDPLVRAYFAGELSATEKATVKQRFDGDADFQLDFLLEEERVRRKYAAMLRRIDPEGVGGRKPKSGRWAIVLGFAALPVLLFVTYYLLSPWRNPVAPQTVEIRPESKPGLVPDSMPAVEKAPSQREDTLPKESAPLEKGGSSLPRKDNDSLSAHWTMQASHVPGSVLSSWERKETQRDPKKWLQDHGISAPGALPGYLWESVVRGKVLTQVPVFSLRQQAERMPGDKPKGNLEVLVFQTAYLPNDQYLFGDSLWLFLRRDLRELEAGAVWVNRTGSGQTHTLHIGNEAYEIRRNTRASDLHKIP